MDSDEDELGQESELALEGSPLAPSIDSPQASNGGRLRMLAETSSSVEDAYIPIKDVDQRDLWDEDQGQYSSTQ
jgi:hypothetical protein